MELYEFIELVENHVNHYQGENWGSEKVRLWERRWRLIMFLRYGKQIINTGLDSGIITIKSIARITNCTAESISNSIRLTKKRFRDLGSTEIDLLCPIYRAKIDLTRK